MSVGAVGAGPSAAFIDPAQTISSTGGALALLVLDTQALQRDADHDRLEGARDAYKEALADEVSSMHAAADQVFWGAIAQGSLGIVAGGASVYGSINSHAAVSQALATHNETALSAAVKPSTAEALGGALAQLGAPTGQLVSGSGGEHSRAFAKAASGEGEQAKWQIDDMKNRIAQSDETTDRAIQWQQTLVDKQDATMNALISNFA
jgi:hypothetical protein